MDNFAYYLRACGGEDRYDVEPLVRAWSRTYDLVVRLTPDVGIRADGVRSTNDRFRDEVEAILDARLPRLRAARPAHPPARLADHREPRLVAARRAARGERRRAAPGPWREPADCARPARGAREPSAAAAAARTSCRSTWSAESRAADGRDGPAGASSRGAGVQSAA